MLAALTDDVDLRRRGYHAKRKMSASDSARVIQRRWQNRLNFQKRKTKEAESKLSAALASRASQRIQSIWYVRTGLADPVIPTRTLRDWCRDFPEKEVKAISYAYIGSVRVAFAEIIKGINRNAVTSPAAQAGLSGIAAGPQGGRKEAKPAFIRHIHDEACMSMQSHDSSLPSRLARSRSSKIQNQCVSVHMSGCDMERHIELQPLLKKDGAQSLINVVKEMVTS